MLVARLIERFEEVCWGEMEPELDRLMDGVSLMIDSFTARMSEEQKVEVLLTPLPIAAVVTSGRRAGAGTGRRPLPGARGRDGRS